MLNPQTLTRLFKAYRQSNLQGRYINNAHILPLLNSCNNGQVTIKQVGSSVYNKPIYTMTVGHGDKRILMWSQMHGNESTTTKAVFDLLFALTAQGEQEMDAILKQCTITIIPILNPDGAEVYTRFNANAVDLNRDAQLLSQPESIVLSNVFKSIKPHFCFNLHGQRTIFSAGAANKSATVSFLSPAADASRSLTMARKKAMEVIVAMNAVLQQQIPNQVGRYDDGFNLDCVGDTFQQAGVPTILFEAGHFPDDYQREATRCYIFQALVTALGYISKTAVSGGNFKPYFDIPENKKLFFDLLIRQADYQGELVDVAIQYEEVLKDEEIQFKPILKHVGDLSSHYGHREVGANKKTLKIKKNDKNEVFEIVIVKKTGGFSPINLM